MVRSVYQYNRENDNDNIHLSESSLYIFLRIAKQLQLCKFISHHCNVIPQNCNFISHSVSYGIDYKLPYNCLFYSHNYTVLYHWTLKYLPIYVCMYLVNVFIYLVHVFICLFIYSFYFSLFIIVYPRKKITAYRRVNNDRILILVWICPLKCTLIATQSHLHNESIYRWNIPLACSCAFSHSMQIVLLNLSDLISLIVLVTLLTKDLSDSILCMLSCSRMTHACRWWMSFALFSLLDMVNTLLHWISSCTNALQMHSSNVSCNKKVLA